MYTVDAVNVSYIQTVYFLIIYANVVSDLMFSILDGMCCYMPLYCEDLNKALCFLCSVLSTLSALVASGIIGGSSSYPTSNDFPFLV